MMEMSHWENLMIEEQYVFLWTQHISHTLSIKSVQRVSYFLTRTEETNHYQYKHTSHILIIKPTRCTSFLNLFLE